MPLVGLALGLPLSAEPRAALQLTRTDVVRRVLETASTFQSSALDARIAMEEVRLARAAFVPKVTAPVQYVHTSPARGVETEAGAEPTAAFVAANAVDEVQALGTANVPVDLSGKLHAALAKSRAQLAAAHAGTDSARRTLISTATQAFYDLALARDRVRDTAQALDSARTFEHISDLLVKAGEAPQVDLVKARLQSAARQDEAEQALAQRTIAGDALRVLIGLDFTTDVEPVDGDGEPDPAAVDRYRADALAGRPELIQADALKRAAQADIQLAVADRRPDLSFSLSGGFDTNALSGTALHEHSGFQSTVGLTLPVFDAGLSRGRQRQAVLGVAKAALQRTLIQRGLEQQYFDARSRALSAARRYQALRATDADAATNLTVSTARYRAGEGDILQVTDAMATLATHRTALAQALHDYRVAMTQLEQVAGR